ncbi:hypothetical protein HanIR_Chr01g0044691 [Helianthus annuus]|nr:hypothetical protein HanIR_Chr01g0044691 [Helianthus annuus]
MTILNIPRFDPQPSLHRCCKYRSMLLCKYIYKVRVQTHKNKYNLELTKTYSFL